MRESHSCTSSFLTQIDKRYEPPANHPGRRSSGSESQVKINAGQRKLLPMRHGSVSGPAHSVLHLNRDGRQDLVTADRWASTSALVPKYDTIDANNAERRSYYDRNSHRMHHRPHSPDFTQSATSSAASTPPCSPYDLFRQGSALLYRRRFLPATPTRPSKVVNVRRDHENKISSSASAVIPLSLFHTSPIHRLRSESQAPYNSIRKDTSEYVPGTNPLVDHLGYGSHLHENADYGLSRPLISPPTSRKIQSKGEQLRPRSQSSLMRRNTAPGRERPPVEVRNRFPSTRADIEASYSHASIGSDEHSYLGRNAAAAMSQQLTSDDEDYPGFSVRRGGSMRMPRNLQALPRKQLSGAAWNKTTLDETSTVISNPIVNRFQSSNDEEVDRIFQSESVRSVGRRMLPEISPPDSLARASSNPSPTCSNLDEEVKVPLLSERAVTPRRILRSAEGIRYSDGKMERRLHSWDDNATYPATNSENAMISDYVNSGNTSGDIATNTNNNNSAKTTGESKDYNGGVLSVEADSNSSISRKFIRHVDSSTYFQGVGEENSPTSHEIARSSTSRYKQELFKSRSPGSTISRRTPSPNMGCGAEDDRTFNVNRLFIGCEADAASELKNTQDDELRVEGTHTCESKNPLKLSSGNIENTWC